MIYDYFRVTDAYDTVLDYADSFSFTLRNDIVQEFDTRWDEILLSMTKIPSDYASRNNSKPFGIVRYGDSSEDIDAQLSKVENHGEEEYKSETSITKL